FEERVEVGQRQLVEVGEPLRRRRGCVTVASPRREGRRERDVGLAGEDEIDEGKAALQALPHRRLPVRTAERDRQVRIRGFHTRGQRERGDVLLEHRGETDERVATPVDLLHPLSKKRLAPWAASPH